MRVLELFSGTGVLSAAFRERGHRTLTVDWSEALKPDWNADIGKLTADEIVARFGHPDVIWASPDCTTYSVMCISRHRDGTKPKTEYAARCDSVNAHVCDLIRQLKPNVWFVENPVASTAKGGRSRRTSSRTTHIRSSARRASGALPATTPRLAGRGLARRD